LPSWLIRSFYDRMRANPGDVPPPPCMDALGYLSCVSSFGSGMATGPVIGRSPARLCA